MITQKDYYIEDNYRKYLFDIVKVIDEIEEATDDRGRKSEIFAADYVFRKFVERNIEIIGEAMNRVLKIKPDIEIT